MRWEIQHPENYHFCWINSKKIKKEILPIIKTNHFDRSEGQIQTDLKGSTAEDKSNNTSQVQIEEYILRS